MKLDSDDTLTMGAKQCLESALEHFKENFTLSQKIDNLFGLIESSIGTGDCLFEFKKYSEAVDNYKYAVQKCIDLGGKQDRMAYAYS
jgi:hypothetical protein